MIHKVYRSKNGHPFACVLSVGRATEEWETVTCPDCLAHKTPPVSPRLDYILSSLRRAVEIGFPWPVSPHEARALVAEVERLRALEADAERARVKADLWSYYEAFVAANGAGSITELVVQRDAARAEAAKMREWAEQAAKAENANAEDARKERAAVVAWLREVSERRFARNEREAAIVFRLAHEIQRGEHRREGEP
jgi:hypothetical protein